MAKKRLGKRAKLEAIAGSGGILTAIAERCNVHRKTVAVWRDADPDIAAAIEEERESLVDLAESVIKQSLIDGDAATARYVASTLGKGRGYTTKSEVDSTVQQVGQVTIFLPDNGRGDSSEPVTGVETLPAVAPVISLPDNGREPEGAA
jgi:transposase